MDKISKLIEILKEKFFIVILIVLLVILATVAAFVIPALRGSVDKGMTINDSTVAMEFTQYNGRQVYGSDVLTAISTYAKDPNVGVRIVLGAGSGGTLYAKNELGAAIGYTPPASPGTAITTAGTVPTAANSITYLEATRLNGPKYINTGWKFNANIYTDTAGNVVLIDLVKI